MTGVVLAKPSQNMNLDELTIEQITSGPVPLDGLLKGSLFYPACCTDGRPIKLCNTAWRPLGINSFVYCDFAVSEAEFLRDARTLCGYHLLAHRHLDRSEYVPQDWALEMVPERGGGRHGGYWDTFLGHGGPEQCACWAVFERAAWKGPDHGPKRISIFFVVGEGLATYQQLYCSRGINPKMLCFIQCWGFAGNWTNFSGCMAPFHRTLLKYKASVPEWLCFGDHTEFHGVIRLRNLDYAGIRLLEYDTPQILEGRRLGEITVLSNDLYRRVCLITRGASRYLAVSVSHHMEYAVYDITDSTMDVDALLDWLILMPEPN